MSKKILMSMLLGLILVLTACGGSGDTGSDAGSEETTEENSSDGSGNSLDISATNFEFDQSEYTVVSGEEVTVNLTNEEGAHGIAIDEFDVSMDTEGSTTFTPDEPGEYTIQCSVPCGEGHNDMESTLIVE